MTQTELRAMIEALKPAAVTPIHRTAARKPKATRKVSWLDSTGKLNTLRHSFTLADARFEVKRLRRHGFAASHEGFRMAEVA